MASGKRIVIDASVARAAGSGPVPEACPEVCRATLMAVQERHRVVFSQEGWNEWDRHESRFARQWRRKMVASRKIVLLGDVRDGELRGDLTRLAATPKVARILEKDAHLVEAAAASDRTVISRDEEVRRCFRAVCAAVPIVRAILWANPDLETERTIAWLREGARVEKARRLDAPPPPSD